MHRPGIEPGPPAWQASILPLNHRCSVVTFKGKISKVNQLTPAVSLPNVLNEYHVPMCNVQSEDSRLLHADNLYQITLHHIP